MSRGLPFPVFLPPNPPAPRMKTVEWFSKTTSPLEASLVWVTVVTAAALPLSRTSASFEDETRVPEVGMGFLIERYCSPWRSIIGEKLGSQSTDGN